MPKLNAPPVASKKAAAKSAPKAAAKKTASKAASKPKDSDLLYPEVEVAVCRGEDAITEEIAMKLLGWRVIPADQADDNFLLRDPEGNYIQCTNNLTNRQLYGSTVSTLAQEILRGRWKLNGENLIIGNRGAILNGQHSLIALVVAVRMYRQDPEAYPYWNQQGREPVMEKFIAYGIEEDDETVNTMDTCKPRTLSDVIYRSAYFSDIKPAERKGLARVLDYAVRLLWFRTGASTEAYAPKRTHAESLAFINLHPTLLKCVKSIAENDEDRNISKIISLGTAAGLMYLMATSGSDSEEYHASENAREDLLDVSNFEIAENFWIAIAAAGAVTAPVRKALGIMTEESGGGSSMERVAVLVKAWNAFSENGTINDKDLKLKYHTDDDGYKQLIECPVTGGVDIGIPSAKEDQEISPEEIQRRMEEVKNEGLHASTDEAKGAKKAAKGAAKKASSLPDKKETIELKSFKDGETLWVTDPENGERWFGAYVDHQSHPSRGTYVKIKIAKGFAGAGKTMDVNNHHVARS